MTTRTRLAIVSVLSAALALISGCGGREGSKFVNLGDLQGRPVDATSSQSNALEFGDVRAGTTMRKSLNLVNGGRDVVEITSTRFESEPRGSFLFVAPNSLNPGDEAELVLTFAPQEPGEYSGLLILEHDGLSGDVAIPVHGRGTSN